MFVVVAVFMGFVVFVAAVAVFVAAVFVMVFVVVVVVFVCLFVCSRNPEAVGASPY